MIVQNVHLEKYANYMIPTLIQNLIWILKLIPIQAAWYLSTVDKHVTKIRISEPFEKATERFKESVVSLKRHIYSQRSQNRHYNHVKESLDHGQILAHVDYAESYKNS